MATLQPAPNGGGDAGAQPPVQAIRLIAMYGAQPVFTVGGPDAGLSKSLSPLPDGSYMHQGSVPQAPPVLYVPLDKAKSSLRAASSVPPPQQLPHSAPPAPAPPSYVMMGAVPGYPQLPPGSMAYTYGHPC